MAESWIVLLIDRRGLARPHRALGETYSRRKRVYQGGYGFHSRKEAVEEGKWALQGKALARLRRPLLLAACQVDGPGYEVLGDYHRS